MDGSAPTISSADPDRFRLYRRYALSDPGSRDSSAGHLCRSRRSDEHAVATHESRLNVRTTFAARLLVPNRPHGCVLVPDRATDWWIRAAAGPAAVQPAGRWRYEDHCDRRLGRFSSGRVGGLSPVGAAPDARLLWRATCPVPGRLRCGGRGGVAVSCPLRCRLELDRTAEGLCLRNRHVLV